MVKTRRTAARRKGRSVPALVMVLLAALAALLVGMAVPQAQAAPAVQWTADYWLLLPSSCGFIGGVRPHGSFPLPRARAAWPGRPHQALSIFRPAATRAEEVRLYARDCMGGRAHVHGDGPASP